MNKERRKQIAEAVEHLRTAWELIESVMDEEQEAYDNLSDGLQCSERGTTLEENIDTLSDALDNISEVVDEIDVL